jgi:hypothetical protein
MDTLISTLISVVVVVLLIAVIAFYLGGVWERFTTDADRKIEERRRREEGRQGNRRSPGRGTRTYWLSCGPRCGRRASGGGPARPPCNLDTLRYNLACCTRARGLRRPVAFFNVKRR